MKRKYGALGGAEDAQGSIYGAPHLESTMLIDTGGIKSGDGCIGSLPDIPVNASMSSGTRLFQYNRFFWNRDLFTFDFNSCGIIISLSWYDGPNEIAYTMFYNVFLPQTALTTYQSLNSGVTFDPATKTRLIDDLLYYLNGMWVANPVAAAPPYLKFPPFNGPLQLGPTFFCYRLKGWLFQPDNHIDFPFFTFGTPPPLKWVRIGSNQNIALIKNPDYWTPEDGPAVTDFDCAFQLINPYQGWTLSEGNPTNKLVNYDGTVGFVYGQAGFIPPSFQNRGSSSHKGWCGRGAFSIGFAQADDEDNFGAYTDLYQEYNDPVLQDLWKNYTTFVGQEPGIKMDGVEWLNFTDSHYLSRYCIIAYFLPNFLPSRYVTISSSILTRDQKLLTISNSPLLSGSNIMGIQFLTLDSVSTWQDATVSGTMPANRTQGSIGGRTNGNDDTPVINMNPFYSVQSIDITISNEWDTVIQNYRSAQNGFVLFFSPLFNPFGLGIDFSGNYVCSYVRGENTFILDNSGGFTANMVSFPIPPWLAALNPLNSISSPPPSQQPLMSPFSAYNCTPLYMIYANNGGVGVQPCASVPVEFSPSMPYSGNIIHFGRVLGY